jgi:hypothetical protein
VRHALFRIRDALATLRWTVTGWLPPVRRRRRLEVTIDELREAESEAVRAVRFLLRVLAGHPAEQALLLAELTAMPRRGLSLVRDDDQAT